MQDALRLCRLLSAVVNREHLTPASLLCHPFRERVRPAVTAGLGGGDVHRALADLHRRVADGPAAEAAPQPVVVPPLPAAHPAGAVEGVQALARHFRRHDLFGDLELLLHGSLATADWCAYSDMDLVLVVRDAAFADPRRLRRVLRLAHVGLRHVFAFDPLQHHGYMAIAEAAFRRYDRSLFPPEVLGHGFALSGGAFRASFAVDADPGAALADLDWYERRMEALARAPDAPRRAYDLKAALSVLMLGPSLYFSAIGRPCYKRDGFAAIADHLPRDLLEPLDAATEARAAWRPPSCRLVRWAVRHSANPTLWWRAQARLPQPTEARARRALTPAMRRRARDLARALRRRAREHAART